MCEFDEVKDVICPECGGSGYAPVLCAFCGGSGEGRADGSSCAVCRGSGEQMDFCMLCEGRGTLDEDETEENNTDE